MAGIDGDRIEAPAHIGTAGEKPDMQAHAGDFQHVALAQWIPGIHHAIMAEGNIDAGIAQFRDPRHAAPLGVGVMAALDGDVDERIGRRMDARLDHQGNELRDIVIVHRMHRGQMRADDAALKTEPLRLVAQNFDMARQRIVRLVAMNIDQEPAFRRDLAQGFEACSTIGHGALEMRNAAHHIDTHVERALEILGRSRRDR